MKKAFFESAFYFFQKVNRRFTMCKRLLALFVITTLLSSFVIKNGFCYLECIHNGSISSGVQNTEVVFNHDCAHCIRRCQRD